MLLLPFWWFGIKGGILFQIPLLSPNPVMILSSARAVFLAVWSKTWRGATLSTAVTSGMLLTLSAWLLSSSSFLLLCLLPSPLVDFSVTIPLKKCRHELKNETLSRKFYNSDLCPWCRWENRRSDRRIWADSSHISLWHSVQFAGGSTSADYRFLWTSAGFWRGILQREFTGQKTRVVSLHCLSPPSCCGASHSPVLPAWPVTYHCPVPCSSVETMALSTWPAGSGLGFGWCSLLSWPWLLKEAFWFALFPASLRRSSPSSFRSSLSMRHLLNWSR